MLACPWRLGRQPTTRCWAYLRQPDRQGLIKNPRWQLRIARSDWPTLIHFRLPPLQPLIPPGITMVIGAPIYRTALRRCGCAFLLHCQDKHAPLPPDAIVLLFSLQNCYAKRKYNAEISAPPRALTPTYHTPVIHMILCGSGTS